MKFLYMQFQSLFIINGTLDRCNIILNLFLKKSLDFYIIGSFDMCNDWMLSFVFHIDLFLKKYEHF